MKSLLNETPQDQPWGYNFECFRLVNKKFIKGKNLLDIGCGFGWWEWHCKKNGVGKIVGLDPSQDSLKVMSKFKDSKISFKLGSALNLPFSQNTFDTLTCWEVLEHIPERTEQKLFDEAYRVLKRGGYFFLSTQFASPISMLLDPAWWLVDHRHYSLKAIKGFAEKTGFKVEKVYKKGGIFTVINFINVYFTKWILRRGVLFEPFFYNRSKKEYLENDGIVNVFIKCHK